MTHWWHRNPNRKCCYRYDWGILLSGQLCDKWQQLRQKLPNKNRQSQQRIWKIEISVEEQTHQRHTQSEIVWVVSDVHNAVWCRIVATNSCTKEEAKSHTSQVLKRNNLFLIEGQSQNVPEPSPSSLFYDDIYLLQLCLRPDRLVTDFVLLWETDYSSLELVMCGF